MPEELKDERGSLPNLAQPPPVFSFPRDARLLKRAQFQFVFDKPAITQAEGIRILARPATGPAKLGFVVAKKQIKGAVERNRIKRLARESFRLHQAQLGNLNLIIMVRSGVEKKSNHEIHATLAQLWIRIVNKCEDLPSYSSSFID